MVQDPNLRATFSRIGNTVVAVVPLALVDGSARARSAALAPVAREAFGDRPFSVVRVERDILAGTATVTLAGGRPGSPGT